MSIRALLCLFVLAAAGCQSIGPGRVARDRFDYTAAVGESWKSQMLLNLVKIRYGDTPVFLDIGQIVAGYSFQRNYSAVASVPFNAGLGGTDTGSFGGSTGGSYNDSPTITYARLSGEQFARQLMSPIPPVAVMIVVQAGFPVDTVFRLAVQAVNGVDNRRVRQSHVEQADPDFYALFRSLHRIQTTGDIGTRRIPGQNEILLEMVTRTKLVAAVEEARIDVASILGLDPKSRSYRLVYGTVPG